MNSNPTRWLILFSIIIGVLFIGTFILVVSGLTGPMIDFD